VDDAEAPELDKVPVPPDEVPLLPAGPALCPEVNAELPLFVPHATVISAHAVRPAASPDEVIRFRDVVRRRGSIEDLSCARV
jgi:hypothetical protein